MIGCLGHLIFFALHIVAVFVGCWPLIITVPLHLIFAALIGGKREKARSFRLQK